MHRPHSKLVRPLGAAVSLAAALALTAACTGPTDPEENATEGIPTETNYPEGPATDAPDVDAPGIGIADEGRIMGTEPEPEAGAETYENELGSGAEPGQPIPGHSDEDPPR